MPTNQTPATTSPATDTLDGDDLIRDIHALTPPPRPPPNRSPSLSAASDGASSENFTTMSREFNALVLAGAEIGGEPHSEGLTGIVPENSLGRIGEEDYTPEEETNPLAIVPENHPYDPPAVRAAPAPAPEMVSLQRVKKEEVEAKIGAWQNAKIAKINNRFKREDAVISGWEREQVQKATSWMKKVERKLEERRARALEKMQNEVAKAHRKAEERRASAEAKRGTKVAKVFEISNLMRAVGRPPAKRSFF